MTCPTLARLQRDEQEFCDMALEFPQHTEFAGTLRDYAVAISKELTRRHIEHCSECRDVVAQEVTR